jgi:ABC-type multidrug transport system ATPase subunit
MKFEFRSVSYMFDLLPVIDSLSLVFPEHGFTVVEGAMGAGKSTLFELLLGDKLPSQGTAYINGQSTKVMKLSQKRELRRKLGIVRQFNTFSHHYTVEENIMLPLFVCGMKENDSRKRTMDILSEYELSHLRSKFPYEVSFGELKLLSFIQATIFEPEFIVADEPTVGLDSKSLEVFFDIVDTYMNENKGVVVFTLNRNSFVKHTDSLFELVDGNLIKLQNSKKKEE